MSEQSNVGAICDECGHLHTPEGCAGPQTPSDIWAGVMPRSCDCDDETTAPAASGAGA